MFAPRHSLTIRLALGVLLSMLATAAMSDSAIYICKIDGVTHFQSEPCKLKDIQPKQASKPEPSKQQQAKECAPSDGKKSEAKDCLTPPN